MKHIFRRTRSVDNADSKAEQTFTVALAGNPNVGKSTVFNALTGLNQHTGNWAGKTVSNAQGVCRRGKQELTLVDIPGTYSLSAHSAEEEVARDFICFGGADAVVVVCDASCLERNLNLALQIMEITDRVVVCVNLLDEARKHGISVDLERLSLRLGVPVVGTAARSGEGLEKLVDITLQVAAGHYPTAPSRAAYTPACEQALAALQEAVEPVLAGRLNSRWCALQLLTDNHSFLESLQAEEHLELMSYPAVADARRQVEEQMAERSLSVQQLRDTVASESVLRAESLCRGLIAKRERRSGDRRVDSVLVSRRYGIPCMILALLIIFWITIVGANYPSGWLSSGFTWLEQQLSYALTAVGSPEWLRGLIADGIFRVLGWVVSVMLPPMAIFFPLFTLLEDVGYLPRVAFNLDKYFQRAGACGKQALSMCMGLGCNAAGVTGCRIIDSPRERLIAILTNNFVPCNGRFPALIAVLTMFFIGTGKGGLAASIGSAVGLTAVIVLGIAATLGVSRLLSRTLLKGTPSSFTLELPPYRRPQIGKVLVRSMLDRTLFVLGRAVVVAAPAGALIWLLANIKTGNTSVLSVCCNGLDPLGRVLGMDGTILMAFILGFPANEIVLPLVMMAYAQGGTLVDTGSLTELQPLLVSHGWTWLTAVCFLIFSLMHWPCSTACLTIRKETGSWKWTALSMLIPTLLGAVLCFVVASLVRLLGLV